MDRTTLGPYTILGELASGGMATVYVARHTRLEHVVAIKVLHPHYQKETPIRTRFVDEARIQANLRHPHILAVQDILELPDATGMVMELLDGGTLSAYLQNVYKPIPCGRAVKLFLPLVDALAYAHSAGVVHRDIKPSNIFLHCQGAEATPKLMDFGIAKLRNLAIAGQVTTAGSMLGTPQYMSPEQIEDSSTVDARADLWAAGVMLYECTVGLLPFPGSTIPELMKGILTAEPKPPHDVRPGFPARLEDAILSCLRKDRNRRCQSAVELFNALSAAAEETGLEPVRSADVPRLDLKQKGIDTAVPITGTVRPATTKNDRPGGLEDVVTERTVEPPALTTDSWSRGTLMPAKQPRRPVWPFVAGTLAAIAVAAGIYFIGFGNGEETRDDRPDAAAAQTGSEQPAAPAGESPSTAPPERTDRRPPAELSPEPPSHQDRPLVPLPGIQLGQACEERPGRDVRILNGMLRAVWQGKVLSHLPDAELPQYKVTPAELEQFKSAKTASPLLKETAKIAFATGKPFKETPLSSDDLAALANELKSVPDLKTYIEVKVRILCDTLPLTAEGRVAEVGPMFGRILSDLKLDKSLFEKLDAAYGSHRLVWPEIQSRAVCCLIGKGLLDRK